MSRSRLVPLALYWLLNCCCLKAVDLYVSPAGNDRNAGRATAPFQTLAAAKAAARGYAGKEVVRVHLADGIYYLPEPLVFTAADSGTADFPVSYQADHEGKAVLSGGLKLALEWQPYKDGILRATTPADLVIDQLFVNGRRQQMARYPDYDPAKTTAAYQGYAADALQRATRWADPTGGFIHAMHVARWGGYHYLITGKKPDGTLAYEGGWQNNRQMGMHAQFRMVENIFEELDAPGEWFHDAKTRTLYFKPPAGIDPRTATVEVVRLAHLIEFKGDAKAPVKQITLRGFTYRHTARTFMQTKEPLLRSDWTIYRGAAVLLTGTEHITLLDSEFDQVGGNAIFVNGYNRRALVKGCHIHDAGASGVCFVGSPTAVRNPLFEYGQSQDLAKIDREPGPKSPDYPADCAVEDCLIHGIGRVERQPAGVQISMAMRISLRDTSIYDCARAGINIGDGCWGGHLVERCDVFDTVLETEDHGAFNSWGRDRYWTANHRGISQPAVQADPKLPFLDAQAPIIIRDSRWRCDHGWDIDLDDGSANYVLSNNLLLAGGLKFREGYGRKADNNILINNGFHPHVWFDNSASEFRHNIVMKAHAPIGQPAGWGQQVDSNFFTTAADLTKHRDAGADAHSRAGDPRFIDPTAGDFRVADDSPALTVGFKNFPMDQFGVKKPALKRIAKTPAIPAASVRKDALVPAPTAIACYWLGAKLHGLEGEEFSAFGTAKADGGVQLADVPAGCLAAKAGFQTNDLIQTVNGRKTVGLTNLFAVLTTTNGQPLRVRLMRNQKPLDMELKDVPFLTLESVASQEAFQRLRPKAGTPRLVTANHPVNNQPLAILTDGALTKDYGPIFANGVATGAYKLDLGDLKAIKAVTSWSFNQNGNRGQQALTIFASAAASDPGWDTGDRSKFIPLGTIDTRSVECRDFLAASLRAPAGTDLGRFRWIVLALAPVSPAGENSAIQELAVEAAP